MAVAFAAGILLWFGLPSAHWWLLLLAGCGACSLLASAMSRSSSFPHVLQAATIIPIFLGLGCAIVWARSEIVGQPPLPAPVSATFTGRILGIEHQPAKDRARLTIAMQEPGGTRAIKVRVNVAGARSADGLAPGDVVGFRARLMPPAPPMLPGGYNFARSAWFAGLAASGSVIGQVRVLESARERSHGLATIRQAVTDHIGRQTDSTRSGLAAALVTGDRGGISAADDEAMRDSGLAHLLSISGLHVSALVGAVYFVVIRLLGLFPWLVLRVRLPIVAAAAGALAGIAYTLLSGSEVPTVRSCAGALLILTALALGREPLSLRMLAAAAFFVLLLWPEAVIGPSFQMSFGAVLALIAISTARPVRVFLGPRDEHLALHAARHVGMLFLTGAVIDLALMPIGLYHFHRAGVYGAMANVLAIPWSTFVVMPLLALSLVMDIVGLGAPFWAVTGWSIDLLLGIAHWFASRPGAVNLLPAHGTAAFIAFVAGGLWLGLWSGRIRWAGVPPAVIGAALLALSPPADIMVSPDGRHVGIMDEAGERLFLLRNAREGYARDNFVEAAGIEGEPLQIEQWPGARCNSDFCAVELLRGGRPWHLLISRGHNGVPERALAAACDRSDIVISDRWLPRSCRARWVKADRAFLQQSGGVMIDLSRAKLKTVADTQGEHGWWRPPEAYRGKRPAHP